MKRKNLIIHYSLFAGMLSALAVGDAFAAVRIGNTSRSNYYSQQIAEQQRAAQVASVNQIAQMSGNVEQNFASPKNTDSARKEASKDAAMLDACSRIYPNGEFEIARPTAGLGAGAAKTCVAVVELRGYQMGKNGSDAVLARANVAAGSTINCNISDFPESSYTSDAGNVLFPSDSEPTVQDVIKQLNQEQKQNAGLKIAAGALIGAVGGNLSGKNDIGKDGLLGTSKSQMTNTVIGAVGGAAIGEGPVVHADLPQDRARLRCLLPPGLRLSPYRHTDSLLPLTHAHLWQLRNQLPHYETATPALPAHPKEFPHPSVH